MQPVGAKTGRKGGGLGKGLWATGRSSGPQAGTGRWRPGQSGPSEGEGRGCPGRERPLGGPSAGAMAEVCVRLYACKLSFFSEKKGSLSCD